MLGRALFRFDPQCLANERYGHLLEASWNGLRPYLNRALFHVVLTRRGQPYTKAIPEADVAGNLESVLDEHLWIASQLDADAVRSALSCAVVGFSAAKGTLPVSAVDTVCANVTRSARFSRDQSLRILAMRVFGSGAGPASS